VPSCSSGVAAGWHELDAVGLLISHDNYVSRPFCADFSLSCSSLSLALDGSGRASGHVLIIAKSLLCVNLNEAGSIVPLLVFVLCV
jgi:hypothetical protein